MLQGTSVDGMCSLPTSILGSATYHIHFYLTRYVTVYLLYLCWWNAWFNL